mgnify:CR=1 FL=1
MVSWAHSQHGMPCGSRALLHNVSPDKIVGNLNEGDCDALNYVDWIG